MNAIRSEQPDTEIRRVFALQKQHQWSAKTSAAAERRAKLQRLKEVMLANMQQIADALYADLRRAPSQPIAGEHFAVIADIDEAIASLDDWMAPVPVEPSPHFSGAKTYITYEARGQCLLFGPWNFPFGLVFQPLVPMIAAGNTAIVKPNEMAPATSRITAKIIREAFDERDVAVFEGGVDLANELLELPFNHIFFTGSPAVGRVVMAAAARHLASVTLELGGKNPAIVDRSADLAEAAAILGVARAENGGQICLCPEYVFVPAELKDRFIEKAGEAILATYYPGGTLDTDRFCRTIDERNLARVAGYLDDARAKGAKIVFGGQIDTATRSVHPAILTDVPAEAKMMREENFAPFLVVIPYQDIAEAIAHVQARPKPLALYVFAQDQAVIDRIIGSTASGGVTVNNVFLHCAETRLPFGGVNESGLGRYHGIHGFREVSHERAVFDARGLGGH